MMNWIKVSDRLPDDESDVLVFDGYSYYLVWYENKIYGLADSTPLKGVTHWMPLPEPPKGE